MRIATGIVLAVAFAVALAMSVGSSPHDADSTAPAAVKASILPIDMMQIVGKDLQDETPREPF
jgi:hypothetical protein